MAQTDVRGVRTVRTFCVNVLTGEDDIDPLTGMARYSGIPVTLARGTIL